MDEFRVPEPEQQLSERACVLLKLLVDRYIAEGAPIGSRTLSQTSGLNVSPATVRNTLSELEHLGYLRAPHTSAGRVPTAQGFRYFVDNLLQSPSPELGEHASLREQLTARLKLAEARGENPASSASELLSQLSQLAAVVTVPRQNSVRLSQIEFVRLAPRKLLVVLVVNDQEVQNRLIELPQDISADTLAQAAAILNAHYAGRDLLGLRADIETELRGHQQELQRLMVTVREFADQALTGSRQGSLAVSGRSHLLSDPESLDVDRLRGLFDALDRKRDLLKLLDHCLDAAGIRIFIGHEAGYEILDNCSLITAPYRLEGESAGVIAVIGPQRMDYGRVISLVESTAQAFENALKSSS